MLENKAKELNEKEITQAIEGGSSGVHPKEKYFS